MSVPKLPSKVALVTGGASGLGRAIAQRLKADGATVVICDVQTELGQATAAAAGFTFISQDVCIEARWGEVIQQIETQFGALHILINNAGILGPTAQTSPENTPLALWQKLFAVNVEGVFLGCRAAIPAMRRAGWGSIVNISSIAGLLATPYATAYGATKATVRQLTKSVAQHCAQLKLPIRCNSVHPGDVHTALWDKSAREIAEQRGISAAQVIEDLEKNAPMGGVTLPEDVAAAVSFLVSDEARRITGAKLVVDGGFTDCDTYHFIRSSMLYAQQ